MSQLTPNETSVIEKQAKELVMAAQAVYPTPQEAMQSFERTGTNLVSSGAVITGAVFLVAARIIRLMLQLNMVEMGSPSPTQTPRNPSAN